MEVSRNQWERIEQTQIEKIDNDKIDHAKLKNIQNEAVINSVNEKNNIDTCMNDKVNNKHYEHIEAENAVKYIEHCVKNMKDIIDQNPAKPKNYNEWTNEEQYENIVGNIKTYVPNIPNSLIFLVPAALHRGDCGRNSADKPSWLDMEKFQRGQKFAQKHIFSIMFANMLSLFEIFVFTDGLKPLILSQQSHTPRLAVKRYVSTARYLQNWMTEDFWNENTQAYKDIQVVRKKHRAMRSKLCKYDYEEIDAASKIPNPWCPDRKIILDDFSSCPYPKVENGCFHMILRPKGLNQADMAATQFAFMGMCLLYPHKLGVDATDEDLIAFCHVWRSIGYVLGIQDEYNFCRGSLKEIKQRARDFIKVWVKPYLRQITPEWEHMLRCVTSILGDNMFKLSLLFVADLLNIDMPNFRKTLTSFQRLQFMLCRTQLH